MECMETTKEHRQAAVQEILKAGSAGTQREFLKLLRARGIRVDQSTLSRDLVELGVAKQRGKYVLPEKSAPRPTEPRFDAAVQSFTTCGPHLIVIRTAIGVAQPLAVQIDRRSEPSITATLAGDDAIFLATKSRRSQVVALRRLEEWFGAKHEP